MTRKRDKQGSEEIKAMIAQEGDSLRPLVRTVVQEIMEAEMSEAVGAQKGERMEGRLGYRSGYYPRASLIQPQDHEPPDRDRSPPLSKSGNSVEKLIPESHLPVSAGYQEKAKPGEPLLIDVSRPDSETLRSHIARCSCCPSLHVRKLSGILFATPD